MTLARRSFVSLGLAAIFVVAVVFSSSDAQARGRRGPSPQQIAAMKKAMQQQQEQAQKLGAAQQKRDKETIARFDTNGNGKIDSNEKPAWDKFWRDVKSGKEPHPYASITPAELKPDSQASKDKATKKK